MEALSEGTSAEGALRARDDRVLSLLRSTFGIDDYRGRQAEALDAVLAGRDVLLTMPTGAGKSLCYQLPAVALDGLTVVARGPDGKALARTRSGVDGSYALEGLPAGAVTVVVAPDAPLGAPGPGGSILRARPEPLVTRPLLGEGSARLDDFVVDIVPLFRIAGAIEVAPEALAAFRADLVADSPSLAELDEEAVRRVSAHREDGEAGAARDHRLTLLRGGTLGLASGGRGLRRARLPARPAPAISAQEARP